MGPSGSGKTTLLNLIAGIDKPTSGSITVGGTDISKLSESALAKWRSANIGFVFQFYNLIPVLTAFENVELPLLLTNLSKAERKNHVETALTDCRTWRQNGSLSKTIFGRTGTKSRNCQSNCYRSCILVADEPTGDLDKNSADEILTLMDRLEQRI